MNECPNCDRFGIMSLIQYLSDGSVHEILAPCLSCSPTATLSDLIAQKKKHFYALELEEVRAQIREHNEYLAWSEGRTG